MTMEPRHEVAVTDWSYGRHAIYCATCGWHAVFTSEDETTLECGPYEDQYGVGIRVDAITNAIQTHDELVRIGVHSVVKSGNGFDHE